MSSGSRAIFLKLLIQTGHAVMKRSFSPAESSVALVLAMALDLSGYRYSIGPPQQEALTFFNDKPFTPSNIDLTPASLRCLTR